jgi:hypothetical protein
MATHSSSEQAKTDSELVKIYQRPQKQTVNYTKRLESPLAISSLHNCITILLLQP